MSDEEKKTGLLGITPAQLVAGALAAVTAAVLGARLNVAGTVVGAAVASVVSTIGSALYQRSLERTTESVRKVGSRAWVIRPVEGDAPLVGADTAGDGEKVHTAEAPPAPVRATRPRWQLAAAASVLVFVVGMLAVTGIEWARGESLSGDGSATTIGAITDRGSSGGGQQQEQEQRQAPSGTDVPSTSTEPVTTAPSTGTPSGGATTSSGSPETSAEPTETSGSTQTSEGVTSTPARPEVTTPSQPTVAPTTGG
jgi:hypothetical protein